jgi:hypothetical protein
MVSFYSMSVVFLPVHGFEDVENRVVFKFGVSDLVVIRGSYIDRIE